MTTVTKQDFEALLKEHFSGHGHIEDIHKAWDYRELPVSKETGIYGLYVRTTASGLTFKGLMAMAELVGSMDIDVNAWSEQYMYSEYTFDDEEGLEFRFLANEVEIV